MCYGTDKADQTDPGFVEKLVTQIVKNVQVCCTYVQILANNLCEIMLFVCLSIPLDHS